jgi:hypothetical protein
MFNFHFICDNEGKEQKFVVQATNEEQAKKMFEEEHFLQPKYKYGLIIKKVKQV